MYVDAEKFHARLKRTGYVCGRICNYKFITAYMV